jgi:hypothetical protein
MASNLFGQPSKDDIRVGYIDPKLGYVSDVSICEANEYGRDNPGTTFLLKDGNNILRYLTLNQVNRLTPSDLESDQDCEGLNQKKPCGPPSIQIYGGGGVGAQANPVIGSDGSLLAVDLVRGGHGYQYEPQVTANDHCYYGSGAVLRAVIGEVSDGFETYADEEDFEEYEICDPNEVGFGRKYGPNGEDLGPWEPSTYVNIGLDPIKTEVEKYEKVVRALARSPFWDTRKRRPNKITASDSRVTPYQTHNVTFDSAWSDFMNSYAVSPVSPSNVKGSDYSGILFTMEWNEDFPLTGEYVFRGLCDNVSQLYIDNEKVFDLRGFADSVSDVRKTITEGIHNIRIDLLNVPIYETRVISGPSSNLTSNIKPKFIQKGKNYFLEVGGTGTGEVTILMDVDDQSFIAGLAAKEVIIPSDGNDLSFKRRSDTPKKETIKKTGKFSAGKTYGPIQINGASPGAGTPKVSNNKLGLLDTDGSDENIKVIITDIKNSKSSSGSSQSTTSSTGLIKTVQVFNTLSYIDKSSRKLWRTNASSGPNSDFLTQYGVSPFDTTTREAQTDSFAGIHVIRWESVNFPIDGNYNIDIMVDDNVTLYIGNRSSGGKINDGSGLLKDEIVIRKRGFNSQGNSTGKTTESRFFKAGSYRIRAELEQISGKPLAKGNPMALAVNIEVSQVEQKIVSPKSWNENPMGVSVTIDAPPEPSPPQEAIPEQEGRCPNNPIWTTRFPTTSQSWYPVKFASPRIITETITVDNPTPTQQKKEVSFTVYGEGAIKDLSFVFTAVDGSHTFVINGADRNKKSRVEKVTITPNLNYIVRAKEDSSKFNSVEQGLIKGGTKDKESGVGTSNKIFADYTTSGNDNDDIQITTSIGSFSSSNKRKAKNSGRNTYDLTYRLESAPGVTNNSTTSTRTFEAPGWSRFMNRYAISPVKPLDTPGSDSSGATYSTSWSIDIPYDGFYGLRGTRDNKGRILIDNNEISTLDGFNNESPKLVKTFLSKGRHTITAELYNEPIETQSVIDQKIFGTKDWQVNAQSTVTTPSKINAKFVQKGKDYYIEVSGAGSGEISFVMDVNDRSFIYGIAAKEISVPSDNGQISFKRTSDKQSVRKSGKFSAGKTYGPIQIIGASPGVGTPRVSNNKLSLLDAEGNDENIKFIITNVTSSGTSSSTVQQTLVGGTSKDGITYSGPNLFHYTDSRWGDFMNNHSISPYLPPLDSDNPEINGKRTYTWKGVKFPESGQYKVAFQADNSASLLINGVKVLDARGFTGIPPFDAVNIVAGTYDIVVEMENTPDFTNIFTKNPVGFGLVIRKEITQSSKDQTPWSSNPMGISAILIPPPCPKKISGRGVVTDILVEDPGNGYTPPPATGTYPVTLRLERVIVENPGINHRCGEDKIIITPSNGAVLDYKCDSFGRITTVIPISPGIGFTELPNITIQTETGINFEAVPVLVPVRDPIVVDPAKLIQVTDLVGLKQNGYIEGRPYYGSVFYKDGIRYAGFYETPGELVQIYNTLQESIDAKVTAAPTAIERSGTDTELSSNNPKLNIPNTPENLI